MSTGHIITDEYITDKASYTVIWYDRWFALENWQRSCEFSQAHKL